MHDSPMAETPRQRPFMAEIGGSGHVRTLREKPALKQVYYGRAVKLALARRTKIKDCPCRRRAAARLVWRAF